MSQINNIGGGGGGGGGGIQTINMIGPTGGGDFTIAAGAGITVTPGSSQITITASAVGTTWTDENVSFAALANNGYFCTAALTATLPASPSQGDTITITSLTNSSVFIQANTGQEIVIGSGASSVAGTAVSNAQGSTITLVYRTYSSTWNATSMIGNWDVA